MGRGYSVEKIKIKSTGRDIRLLIFKPDNIDPAGAPGVLWIHGGGYATGMTEMVYMGRALSLVKR